jgi:hypothetical protein
MQSLHTLIYTLIAEKIMGAIITPMDYHPTNHFAVCLMQ